MSKKRNYTERYAHSLGITVDEFLAKRGESDYQMIDLRGWLNTLNCGITVRRSHTNYERFVFEREGGHNVGGAVDYERARSFLAGLTQGIKYGKLSKNTS